MKTVHKVLAYLIAIEVMIQAALIAFAVAGIGVWVMEEGGALDEAAFEAIFEGELSFTGVAGMVFHGMNGMMVIPLLALLLLITSFFAKTPGAIKFSLLTFTAAVTGNFTIRASSFSSPGDPGTGGYTVDVRVQGADAVGDTNATAVVLSQGTTFGFRETATVSGGADLDRYEVTLEAGKYYTFKLAAGADYATNYLAVPAGEIDTILRLRDDTGTLVAQNDDNKFPSDISSGFGFFATASGTYYLDVTGYAGQTGGYVIDFQEIDYENMDPLDAIRWASADNIDTVTVGSQQVAYVYFGAAGETFGESRPVRCLRAVRPDCGANS